MRRMRVLGSTLGLFALATGCATTAGGPRSTTSSSGLQITRMSRAQQVAWRDSVYAQAIADAEGPGASIRAEFSNLTGSRRVRGVFNLESDAYVIVGHIDAEGVLRIAFPLDPTTDDGFVKANRQYRTHEFFAGFTDQYRWRAQQSFMRPSAIRNSDSYDGGLGYLFIIASWRPMRFDRFSTEGSWDSFELADESYMRDPRPAIYELASLLVGENREAYTVKFARYNNSRTLYGDGFYSSAFNSFRYCAGYRPLGFGYYPIDVGYGLGFGDFGYGMNGISHGYAFSRRGTNYYYDSFGDCYRTGYPGGGYGGYSRYAGLTPPQRELPKRAFDPEGGRVPFSPRIVATHSVPGQPTNPTASAPTVSSSYRMRGLITSDDPTGGRREPRDENRGVTGRSRPAIQEMVSRAPSSSDDRTNGRVSNGYNNGSNSRARPQPSDRNGYSSPTYRDRTPVQTSSGESRGYMGGYSAPTDVSRSPGSSSSGSGASTATPVSAPPSGASSGPPGSSSGTGGSRPPTP